MTKLQEHIDWFIWRTTQNHNVSDKVEPIRYFCNRNFHNISICLEILIILKYLQGHPINDIDIDQLKYSYRWHLNEFRYVRVRKNVDKLKHLRKEIFEYYEYNDINELRDRYKEVISYLENISENEVNDILQSIMNELDNIINIVVDNTKEITI